MDARRNAIMATFGVMTHLILDMALGYPGIALFWPNLSGVYLFGIGPQQTQDVFETVIAGSKGSIAFMLFDMASKGVTTKPILLISGNSPFCETFFDDVEVPKTQYVGEINRGWDVAKYLLGHEREMISGGGAGGFVAPDTISGLGNWPPLRAQLLALLGLLAISLVHIPVAEEARDSLERDFKWSEAHATISVALLPIALVALGLTNFFETVGIAGGVFLSTEYIVVALVVKNALHLSRGAQWFMNFVIAIFFCAAIYEIAAFVVR
jgi:hypothetical protein